MNPSRLEAFSDGVIAIIITIMVLELRVPHDADLGALAPLLPVFLSYILSFTNIGIYWNNHHHLLRATPRVNGAILWANLHLLFWLSLMPFVTAWMGENHFAPLPTALYGADLLLCGASYYVLAAAIMRLQGPDGPLARAVGPAVKEKVSVAAYAVAIPAAFLRPWISWTLYILVAAMWLVPDSRIERSIAGSDE
ncbi:MAG TPA: TMEM175 family protein [Gemmatimonadaceae bacterium]|nr:TMEM175 family protein [Gemmatimonadaceae bacterium]